MRNAFVQGGSQAPLGFYMEKNIFYLFIALLNSFQQAFGKCLGPDLQSINPCYAEKMWVFYGLQSSHC